MLYLALILNQSSHRYVFRLKNVAGQHVFQTKNVLSSHVS